MKKLLLLIGALALPCAAHAAAVTNTCEVRATATNTQQLCDGSGCRVARVEFSDGPFSTTAVDCDNAPPAWDSVAGWSSHCAAMAVGDCFHAQGVITPVGCEARSLFSKIPAVYCNYPVNKCAVRGTVASMLSICPPDGPCYRTQARIDDSPNPNQIKCRCDASPQAWDSTNGFTSHCQSAIAGDCVEAEGFLSGGVCVATGRFSKTHPVYCPGL